MARGRESEGGAGTALIIFGAMIGGTVWGFHTLGHLMHDSWWADYLAHHPALKIDDTAKALEAVKNDVGMPDGFKEIDNGIYVYNPGGFANGTHYVVDTSVVDQANWSTAWSEEGFTKYMDTINADLVSMDAKLDTLIQHIEAILKNHPDRTDLAHYLQILKAEDAEVEGLIKNISDIKSYHPDSALWQEIAKNVTHKYDDINDEIRLTIEGDKNAIDATDWGVERQIGAERGRDPYPWSNWSIF